LAASYIYKNRSYWRSESKLGDSTNPVSEISSASKVRAEKPDVTPVGAKKDVERVTSDRNGGA